MKKLIKVLLAELLFFFGHTLVVWSAILSDCPDTAKDLRKSRAYWLKKTKER